MHSRELIIECATLLPSENFSFVLFSSSSMHSSIFFLQFSYATLLSWSLIVLKMGEL